MKTFPNASWIGFQSETNGKKPMGREGARGDGEKMMKESFKVIEPETEVWEIQVV